jgi:hypothetical protein
MSLQDKHNIRTLSENIKFICTPAGKQDNRQWFSFLPVSKARTNKLAYTFSDNVRVLIALELRNYRRKG